MFGGRLLRWDIFCTPSIICLPGYLRFLVIIISLLGGWVGYELSKLGLGNSLFSVLYYRPVVFSGSMWFVHYFSTYGVSVSFVVALLFLKVSDLG
jgi:hypothetical protein